MINPYFNISEQPDSAIIEIFGSIGQSWWSDGVTFQSVNQQLKDIAKEGKTVTVKINSYGGDVNEALAIYETLRSMGDKVTTECFGFCASAATIIAMAGHTRRMSSCGLFLVHKCSSGVCGNENDLQAEIEAQRTINEQIVKIYADTTGSPKDVIEQLMNENNGNGRWLSVEEAISFGFVTEEIQKATANQKKQFFNMFNLFKNHKEEMKKNISSLAMICAVLALQELEAKDDKAFLDDEQLEKINNHIKQLDDKLAENTKAAQEALNDKNLAEEKLKEALKSIDQLKAKADELQKIIDKTPANTLEPIGDDPKEEFADYMANDDFYKSAKAELGK